VFLESPKRIVKTLQDMLPVIGSKEVCVGRELTKLHEEFISGTCEELLVHFATHTPRGEMVVMVGAPLVVEAVSDAKIRSVALKMADADLSPSALARAVAQTLGVKRSHVYQLLMDDKEDVRSS